MAYAVYRFEKVKDWGQVAAMGRHNERTRDTPNADPERQWMNERLAGSGDWVADVRGVIGDATVYKNSVLTYDLVLSASPEWFRQASPDQIRAWQRRSMEWMSDTFGAHRIAAAIAHRDEKTMHIQAAIVPIVDDGPGSRRGRHLAASRWTDGSEKTSGLQTSYALAVEPLGIQRGIKGSRATHQSQHRWYAQDQERADRAEQIKNNPRAIQQELERRDTAELRARRAEATARAQARTIEEQKRQLDATRTDYKALADEVRGIDLGDVLTALGATQDRHDRHMWRLDGHRINVDATGRKFTDYGPGGGQGGGAIDLVKHVTGYGFTDAVDYLAQRHGVIGALAAVREHAPRQVEEIAAAPFQLPARDEDAWPMVRAYLTRERRLSPERVDELHERGDVYAERSGRYTNAVFVRRDEEGTPTGASRRGVGTSFKGLARGSDRERGHFTINMGALRSTINDYTSPALVVVESAIDAMSYADLHPHMVGQIVSTDGNGEPPTALMRRALDRLWTMRGAFDRDLTGDAMWEVIKDVFPAEAMGDGGRQPLWRETPKHGKDWNDELWHTRERGEQKERGEGRSAEKGGHGSESGPDMAPPGMDIMGR